MVNLFHFQIGEYKIPVMTINLKKHCIINLPTQIGCAIGCTFCVSTTQEFIRNLSSLELIDIVDFAMKKIKHTNYLISFTGEGEPFLNLKNINKAINTLEHYNCIDAFRICTSGIKHNLIGDVISNIKPLNLQFSFHSPFDEKRKTIIPKTKLIADIVKSMKENSSNYNEISINYVLIEGFNDSIEDFNKSISILDNNWIIKLNPLLKEGQYFQSGKRELFAAMLRDSGFDALIFNKVGSTIKSEFFDSLTYQKNALKIA